MSESFISRRDLLAGAVRLGVLAGVAAGLGVLCTRPSCAARGPCGGCPQFGGCDLPEAQAQRKAAEPSKRAGRDAEASHD